MLRLLNTNLSDNNNNLDLTSLNKQIMLTKFNCEKLLISTISGFEYYQWSSKFVTQSLMN